MRTRRGRRAARAAILAALALALAALASAAGPAGAQTTTDYDTDDDGLIEISSLAQLNAVRHDLDGDGDPTSAGATAYGAAFLNRATSASGRMGCPTAGGCTGYELFADLDFDANGDGDGGDSGDHYYNGGLGWDPVGDTSNRFSATFEGNNRTVSHLFVNRPGGNRAGLFARTNGAAIRNLGLPGASVTAAGRAGALAGHADVGSVSNCYSTGSVTVSGDRAGGLLGQVNGGGTVTGSYSTASVTASGGEAGGLVGLLLGGSSVSSSYAAGAVSATTHAGGLAGRVDPGDVSDSYATGDVSSANASANVGGLVGKFQAGREGTVACSTIGARVAASYATGAVSATATGSAATARAGGLIGELHARLTESAWACNRADAWVIASYATGAVHAAGGMGAAGGLVGLSTGSRTPFTPTTGLVPSGTVDGVVAPRVVASYAAGAVTAASGASAGGLIGSQTAGENASASGAFAPEVADSYWDAGASGQSASAAGTARTTRELQSITTASGIYADWDDLDADRDGTADEDPWNFGTDRQYPAIAYGGLAAAGQRDAVAWIRPDHWNFPVVGEPVVGGLFDQSARAHPDPATSSVPCDGGAATPDHRAWTWQRSDNGSTGWADVSGNRLGACTYAYVPVSGDAGKHLRACVPLTAAAGGGTHCTRPTGKVGASGSATAATAGFAGGDASPSVGAAVTVAALPAHSDRTPWRWQRCTASDGTGTCTLLAPADPSWSYTPVSGDAGGYLRAFVYYANASGTWTRAATGFTGAVP